MQVSGKSNLPSFTRGATSKSHEGKKKSENQESTSDQIKELTELIKKMEIDHATQMTAMQNRLIAMERAQASGFHHKPNNGWQKRDPPQEQRPPNPLETINLVDHQVIPYCRPCGEFHEESTCPTFLRICEGEPPRRDNEQINIFRERYNVPMNDQMELIEYSRDVNCMINNVDKVT